LKGEHEAMELLLPSDLGKRLCAWSLASLPEEACGLLLGRPAAASPARLADAVEVVEVVEVVQTRNLAAERRADLYEVHPEDFLAADRRAAALGLEIVGVWHSHPQSPGRPSATDLERAWPGWSYVIVGRATDGGRELRSWRLIEPAGGPAAFAEERLSPPIQAPLRPAPLPALVHPPAALPAARAI
jgi:proteasome lid subunit RPN8/RPN11